MATTQFNNKSIQGLNQLAASSFPKSCCNCGRLFISVEQFLSETQDTELIHSKFKESYNLSEALRKCPCGSELAEEEIDRRVLTDKGQKRRETIGRMLAILEKKGIDTHIAKAELIKATHGKVSDFLETNLRISKTG